jgi:acyl carrier protein
MSIWPFVLVGSLLLLVGLWVYARLPRWRAEEARARREPLTEQQFGERFFTPDLAQIAARVQHIASHELGKDLSRLHPDDRFDEGLSDPMDSMDTVEMLMAIEEEFGIELEDAAVTNIKTFGDLVTAVAAQRPFLLKWRREMGRAIEQHFGVSLTRQVLATLTTPLALTNAVAAELKVQDGAEQACQSQRAFYRLRQAMMRTLRVPRSSIAPGTALRQLISWRAARSVWPQLRDAVAARKWPVLVRPQWASWLVYGLPLLGGAAVVIGLPWLAEWAARWGSTLGFAVSFASEMRAILVIPLVVVVWVLLVRFSKRLCWAFPRGIGTVGDLVPFVVTSPETTWTREHIEQKVREIVITQMRLPAERYQAGGRFVEELGLEND